MAKPQLIEKTVSILLIFATVSMVGIAGCSSGDGLPPLDKVKANPPSIDSVGVYMDQNAGMYAGAPITFNVYVTFRNPWYATSKVEMRIRDEANNVVQGGDTTPIYLKFPTNKQNVNSDDTRTKIAYHNPVVGTGNVDVRLIYYGDMFKTDWTSRDLTIRPQP